MLRRALGQKKIGHLGTLDPAAAGVMVMLLGRATRLFDRIAEGEKEYVAVFSLGVETDTLDREGKVTRRIPWTGGEEELARVLPRFRGEITQIPPMYSAVTLGGERLYHMARRGAEIEIPKRVVTVSELELLNLKESEAKVRIVCSKGTYVRSLARDIAEAMGTCAHVAFLLRTRSGAYTLEEAVPLYEAAALCSAGEFAKIVQSMEDALELLPAYCVPSRKLRDFRNGIPLDRGDFPEGEYCRLYAEDAFIGVGRKIESATGRVLRFDLRLEEEHADTGTAERG